MTQGEKILEAVNSCEGLSSKELCSLLDIPQTSFSVAILPLVKSGKIRRKSRRQKNGKGIEYTHFKGDDIPFNPTAYRRSKITKQPTEAGWHARYDALVVRVKELEAWRENAIERFPDLQVSEDLLKARRIAAKANPDFSASLLSGEKDSSPIIRAVLAAIEELAA